MKITRNVILDLLPLYLADEVSADTAVLVREFLETDPELNQVAERMRVLALENGVPVTLEKEESMEAYEKAKQQITQRIVLWAIVLTLGVLTLLGASLLAVMFLTSI